MGRNCKGTGEGSMRATKYTGWFKCYNCKAERDRGYEVDRKFARSLKWGETNKPNDRVILCKECYKYCRQLRRREK